MSERKIILGLLSLLSQEVSAQTFQTAYDTSMMQVVPEMEEKIQIKPVYTIGESLPSSEFPDGYVTPGILDGMGAWKIDQDTVRVYSNHELRSGSGYPYDVCGNLDCTSTYQLNGARISFFDFDVETVQIKDSGISYKYVYGSDGTLQSDSSWLDPGHEGFSRFCSAQFVDANEYGFNRGIVNAMQFGPEEVSMLSSSFGGHFWALDTIGRGFWRVPALGRGAWESITQIDTDTESYVAFVMPDDTSPIDVDGVQFAAPLYLYVGEKDPNSNDFLAKNGLRGGTTYVWIPDNQNLNSPLTFNGNANTQAGTWAPLDTARDPEAALETTEATLNGVAGTRFLRDGEGFPTQLNQWIQANEMGAFKFARPEDISTYSRTGNEFVVTSTGIGGFNGTNSFGTIYTMELTFTNGIPDPSNLTILIDGDEDPDRKMRSPDNLEWADDGYVYVQEDRAVRRTITGEAVFGEDAVNNNTAQLVRINGTNPDGIVTVLAALNRSVLLDASLDPENATKAVDVDSGDIGAWESTGIIEVSALFNRLPGSLFLGNIQAHGIENQEQFNPSSRIRADDLVEGGQMMLIEVEVPSVSEASANEEHDDNDYDLGTLVLALVAFGILIVGIVFTPNFGVKADEAERNKRNSKFDV